MVKLADVIESTTYSGTGNQRIPTPRRLPTRAKDNEPLGPPPVEAQKHETWTALIHIQSVVNGKPIGEPEKQDLQQEVSDALREKGIEKFSVTGWDNRPGGLVLRIEKIPGGDLSKLQEALKAMQGKDKAAAASVV